MDVKASTALTSDGRLQGSVGGSNTNLGPIRIKSIQCQSSAADGEVKKILIEDGQPVEFGQTLILLK